MAVIDRQILIERLWFLVKKNKKYLSILVCRLHYINSLNGSLFVSHWTIPVQKKFHWNKLAKYQSEEAQNVILWYFSKHNWSKGLFLVFFLGGIKLCPFTRCIFHQKSRKCQKQQIFFLMRKQLWLFLKQKSQKYFHSESK